MKQEIIHDLTGNVYVMYRKGKDKNIMIVDGEELNYTDMEVMTNLFTGCWKIK